jgi:hypothetical protein
MILNPLRKRKESGMKIAIIKAASFKSSAPSESGRALGPERQTHLEVNMLGLIIIILVVLWALGFFAFHVGGLIHALIVIALIILIVRLLKGRKIF